MKNGMTIKKDKTWKAPYAPCHALLRWLKSWILLISLRGLLLCFLVFWKHFTSPVDWKFHCIYQFYSYLYSTMTKYIFKLRKNIITFFLKVWTIICGGRFSKKKINLFLVSKVHQIVPKTYCYQLWFACNEYCRDLRTSSSWIFLAPN